MLYHKCPENSYTTDEAPIERDSCVWYHNYIIKIVQGHNVY